MQRPGTVERWYRVLDLNPSASLAEISRAHRDLATVWHPDRFSNDPRLRRLAEEKLKSINEAYQGLRRIKDAETRPNPPRPDPPPQSPERPKFVPLGKWLQFSGPALMIPVLFGGLAVWIVVAGGAAMYRVVARPAADTQALLHKAQGSRGTLPDVRLTLSDSVIAGAAALSAKTAGTFGADPAPAGAQATGTLRIANRTAAGAFARITTQSGRRAPVREAQVPAGAELLLRGFGPGTYSVSVAGSSGSGEHPASELAIGPLNYPERPGDEGEHYDLVISPRNGEIYH